MSSPFRSRISRRRRKTASLPDLRHIIAYKRVASLTSYPICLIGARGTGRNTIARRFLHMSDGPFHQRENRRYRVRSLVVERPGFPQPQTYHLCVSLWKLEDLDFQTIFLSVPQLKSFAVVFDVGSSNTFSTAIHCMVKITELLVRDRPRFILVGNKIDLPHPEVSTDRGVNVAATCKAERYFECSALMNVGMDPVLDSLLLLALHPHRDLS